MAGETARDGRLEALTCAFEGSPDLVFAANTSGEVIYLNPAARRTWKGAESGAPALALLPSPVAPLFAECTAALLATGVGARFEWGDEGPEGVRVWFGCTLSPVRIAGAMVGYVGVSSDCTDLKKSEQRLRRSEQLMVDTQGVAHLGTWQWDVSEPQATWSEELYRIYGLRRDTYVPSYENYLTLVHPDDRQRVIDATNRVFHEHVPYSHDERIFRPDGSLRYLHTWAHPELDPSGRLVRLVGVCQDITDRKLAEEAVRQLNGDLEQRVVERTRTIENARRDLEAFNVMASHDLRAPLSIIQGSCQIIQRRHPEALPPPVVAHLDRILRAVAHMSALVTDLLRLAQVGQAPLARAEVDLTAMCNDVVALLRRTDPDRTATVHVQEGLRALADPGLIRVVVDNLLNNAWKYSSRRPDPTIEVGASPLADGRRSFFVRDNGAGFDMKDAHKLFAPFQRLHKASDFEGTGVGLTAVHRIIERHGGRIWAEGEPERGATFSFELPVTPGIQLPAGDLRPGLPG